MRRPLFQDEPYRNRSDIDRSIEFANTLGIPAAVGRGWGGRRKSFLPGIVVYRGSITVNPGRIRGYDDFLHEVGHLAVLPKVIRQYATHDADISTRRYARSWMATHPFLREDGTEDPVQRALLQSGETEVIAWSYAAQVHLGLSPRLLLANCSHQEMDIVMSELSHGRHLGVNGLQAAGMTTTRQFPQMIRWAQP